MPNLTFPQFGAYVCGGDSVEVEHEGFTLRATVHRDTDMGAPWDEHDGHGIVSDWTSRDKRPGERALKQDGRSYLYYDFEETMRVAMRDGWGPLIPYRTAKIARAVAVEQDFEAMRAWANDEWHWCGVSVTVYRAGIRLTEPYSSALWGIEMNYPGSDNSYLSEVAGELADQALEAAKAKLSELV